jgi:nicotinamidase-related amidase
MVQKGTDPYSEMYGIIEPEFSESNFLNTPVLNAIEKFDAIYVAGEAASHCLMESVRQIATHFANRPEITQKITILEDCTSPIPGYEADTKAAFDMFKNTYGIKFAKSTDIQLV